MGQQHNRKLSAKPHKKIDSRKKKDRQARKETNQATRRKKGHQKSVFQTGSSRKQGQQQTGPDPTLVSSAAIWEK